jgi:hypothetical protein
VTVVAIDGRPLSAREQLALLEEQESTEASELAELEAEEAAIAELANRKVLAEAYAKHGKDDVRRVDTILGMVIAKAPTYGNYQKFRKEFGREETKDDAVDFIVRQCVIHPDKSTLDKWLTKKPAMRERIADACVELAGAVGGKRAKK